MFDFKLLRVILILISTIQISELAYVYSNYDLHISKKVVNPHDFKYIKNPGSEICDNDNGKSVFLLIYVHTSPSNFGRRQAIRETWGKRSMFPDNRIIFTMGATPNTKTNELLTLESNYHNDIVQEDFLDSYKNLTHKKTRKSGYSRYLTNLS